VPVFEKRKLLFLQPPFVPVLPVYGHSAFDAGHDAPDTGLDGYSIIFEQIRQQSANLKSINESTLYNFKLSPKLFGWPLGFELMIKLLKLTNFRSHRQSTLQMEPVTLMVGPAGAGKSNIFKALVVLQNSIHRTLVEVFPPGLGEFHWVRSRWAGETDPIGFEVHLDQVPGHPDCTAEYILKIADSPAGLYVLEETLVRRENQQQPVWVFQRRQNRTQMGEFGNVDWTMPTILHRVWHSSPGVNSQASNVRFARAVAQSLSRFGYYHLEVSKLKSLGIAQDSERIGYHGEGLPEFIAWAKSTPQQGPIYEAILGEMRQLLPSLDSIIVTQVETDKQGLAFAFKEHRGYITARDMSDGTMFTLGMLCLAHMPQKPQVLCVEEPETGLHPRRLRWLFEKFVALAYPSEDQTPIQVLLTTHSPSYVELFKDMLPSIQVVEEIDGQTRVSPLLDILHRLHIDEGSKAGIGYQWATGVFEGGL
jgi:predicted ATPase